MLEVDTLDGVTSLTLANAERRNALSPELVSRLVDELGRAATNGTRLIVLRGAGKAFCAGFDLSALEQQSHGDLLLRIVEIEQMLQAVHHSPVPTVALGHGACFGAGADLFAACTYRVCDPGTKFMFPGPRFGLVLGSRRLAARIGQSSALRLVCETRQIRADEALMLGLATDVVATENWAGSVSGVAEALGSVETATHARLASVIRDDTRDQDLADLVRSAASSDFRDRLMAYAGRIG